MIDRWLLRSAAIQEKMIQNSGLTLEELIAWDKEQSRKAVARLADLNISDPWIKPHPNVKQGNKAFPRTLWYCTPEILCSQYHKWLAFYAPVQLKQLCELFPEIQAKFTTKKS
jgi:hypothetical protein